MRPTRSYFQRLAAPLSPSGPTLFPLAKAAPDEARPPAILQSPPSKQAAPPAAEASAAAPALRPHPLAMLDRKTPPGKITAAAAIVRPAKPTPPEPAATAASQPVALPEIATPAPPRRQPLLPKNFPIDAADTHAGSTEFDFTAAATAKAAAPPPGPPPLIWGEPIALPSKPATSRLLDAPPATPPAKPAVKSSQHTEIHIGTIEVRTASPAPKAAPLPPPSPRAAPPAVAAPVSRAYGWRFGLSQR